MFQVLDEEKILFSGTMGEVGFALDCIYLTNEGFKKRYKTDKPQEYLFDFKERCGDIRIVNVTENLTFYTQNQKYK